MSHDTIFSVFEALPPGQKSFWGINRLARNDLAKVVATGNPDVFCGATGALKRRMAKYFFTIHYAGDRKTQFGQNNRGRLFHYLPVDTDIAEGCGAWQSDSTGKWRFVSRGFRLYFKKILAWARNNRIRDALTAACALCHFLQDQTAFFHSLEGEEGGSQWMLDELIPTPAGSDETPTSLLVEWHPAVDLRGYRARLLGIGIEEACFHLYQRYRAVKRANRQRIIPCLQAHYRGDRKSETRIRGIIARATAELTADVFYTLYCLATRSFPRNEIRALEKVSLVNLQPINYLRHACPPYRFSPMLKNHALDFKSRKCGLSLLVREHGKLNKRSFARGIGLGCHRQIVIAYPVPPGVFQRFETWFGLHSRYGRNGHVHVTILLGNRTLARHEFNRAHPAARLRLDIAPGGILTFVIQSKKKKWNDRENNLVLGEPVFLKPEYCA